MHIGILTGGGDAPGLNAVIRAAVKTAVGVELWSVNLQERSHRLHKTAASTWGAPSPDRKHPAFVDPTIDSNICRRETRAVSPVGRRSERRPAASGRASRISWWTSRHLMTRAVTGTFQARELLTAGCTMDAAGRPGE